MTATDGEDGCLTMATDDRPDRLGEPITKNVIPSTTLLAQTYNDWPCPRCHTISTQHTMTDYNVSTQHSVQELCQGLIQDTTFYPELSSLICRACYIKNHLTKTSTLFAAILSVKSICVTSENPHSTQLPAMRYCVHRGTHPLHLTE